MGKPLSAKQRLERARESMKSARAELATEAKGRDRTYMVLRTRKHLRVVYRMTDQRCMSRRGATPEQLREAAALEEEADQIWPTAQS